MFEPPMERCPVCGDYVALVQSQGECANSRQCGRAADCPLQTACAVTDFYRAPARAVRPATP